MIQQISGRRVIKLISFLALTCLAVFAICAATGDAAVRDAEINPNAMPFTLDEGAPGLSRYLAAIRTRASMLMVVAHPDDEDGGLLVSQSRGLGARTSLMTLNRGEGGQNAMSIDMYDALGIVRTEELLKADRYYGVDQYWGTVIDYGFSKTREEALQEWGGADRVLGEVVRVVRMTRPLVITSVFAGAATDGHGNHQVSGQMAQEAYVAAGDPKRFPEQLKEGLRPWTPLKVYARVSNVSPTKENTIYDSAIDKYVPMRFYDYVNKNWITEKPSITIQIAEGVRDPAVGLTYQQIAREGWGYQKSQNGGGTRPQPTLTSTPYHRYGSRVSAPDKEKSLYDGIDVSLMGISTLAAGDTAFLKQGLQQISKLADDAHDHYKVDDPGGIAPTLADGLKATHALLQQVQSSSLAEPGKSDVAFELQAKEEQFQQALVLALGLNFDTVVVSENTPGRGGRGGRGGGADGGQAGAAASTPGAPGRSGRGGATEDPSSAGTPPVAGPPANQTGGNATNPPGRGGAALASAPEGAPPAGGGSSPFTGAIPGQSFAVQVNLLNDGNEPVGIEAINVNSLDGKAWNIKPEKAPDASLDPNKDLRLRFSVKAPADATLTRPYFTRPSLEQGYYNLTDPRFENLSFAPYPLAANLQLTYHGAAITLSKVVQATHTVEGIGNEEDPLIMAPALAVAISPTAGAVPLGSDSFEFSCSLHSNVKGAAEGYLHLSLPDGWESTPKQLPFSMARDGQDETFTFHIKPHGLKTGSYQIKAIAEYQGHSYQEGYRLVGYSGLRSYPYYRPATYTAVGVDVKTAPSLKVGFFPGTGDEVPGALDDLGIHVQTLSGIDIASADLSSYDAIILGVRAYAVRPELRAANNRLLAYVNNGGVLIVQYNIQNFNSSYGPYPLNLGTNPQRVVDETSEVKLLNPASPLFSWPNKITAEDFRGWEEERGHGFPEKWDSHYEALVETHDPDQDPQSGGLLLAHYGKGLYIYDAFALYRQLPSGVPGAYRILANLVSAAKNPQWR